MESTSSEKDARMQTIKEKYLKDYKQMHQQGLDAFSLLGLSQSYHKAMKTPNYLRSLIAQVLNEEGITEESAPNYLLQIRGADIGKFEELVNLVLENHRTSQPIGNKQLNEKINHFTNALNEKTKEFNSSKNVILASDFIALTQVKSIEGASPKLNPNLLLTKEMLNANNLKLNADAIAYDRLNKEEVYGWPFVKAYWRHNELDMPLKNYYHNVSLLNEEDKKFPKLKQFRTHVLAKGYKLLPTIKSTTLEDTVLITGKKLMYDNDAPISETEKSLLMMYELNLEYLKPKRKKIGIRRKDRVKKELKAYLSDRTRETDLETIDFIKTDKRNFGEYLFIVKDVVATLATINQARIYLTGDTFKKVEENLTIQASMKLSKLPNIYSEWIMPYIAEKVYEMSAKNYKEAGITNLQELKALYENTGRDVLGAKDGREVVYAPLKQLVKENVGKKEQEKTDKTKTNTNNTEKTNDTNTTKENTIKENTTKETNDNNANTENKEPQSDNLNSDLLKAKDSLKIFLDENLLMKNSFSETPAIAANAAYIEMLNKEKVNMQAISDFIYNKIVDDMLKNSANYKKPDGHYHKYGVDLLKDYFKSIEAKHKPRDTFKSLIKEAQKNTREAEFDFN